MSGLERVSAALDALSSRIGRAVAWLALAMVLIGVWNALARYGGRTIGVDLASNGLIEAQWYLFSVLFLLGASYTLREDAHVRVDVVYGRAKPRTRAWIDLLGTLLLMIPFCVAAIYFAWPSVAESWSIREQSPDPGGLPRWPLKALAPVAFVLLILQGISEGLKRVVFLVHDGPSAAEEGNDAGRRDPEEQP